MAAICTHKYIIAPIKVHVMQTCDEHDDANLCGGPIGETIPWPGVVRYNHSVLYNAFGRGRAISTVCELPPELQSNVLHQPWTSLSKSKCIKGSAGYI